MPAKTTRKSRALERLPEAVKAAMREGNQQNAEEFDRRVRLVIPRGADDDHLADTLTLAPVGETGFKNTLGDAEHPYPFHLEGGHRTKDGVHVPGKPFWNPTKTLMVKRGKARMARKANAAIKGLVQ